MELLEEYTPDHEKFSIDEIFLDMTSTIHLFGSPLEVANEIRERIRKDLGFTVNIGISTNKLLAKMASDFEKPDKCHTLFPREVADKMWPLPIRELFFVGGAAQRKWKTWGCIPSDSWHAATWRCLSPTWARSMLSHPTVRQWH